MVYSRGHTILEMLLVVGILAVLVSAHVPRLNFFLLKKDAQRLMAFLNYAQRQAIENGCRFTLDIDSTAKNFCLKKYGEGPDVPDDVCLRSFRLDDATSAEAEVPRIVFYPDSHMTPNVVTLRNRDHSVIFSTTSQWGKVDLVECTGDCRDL